jgi:tripartite motif-containing protein 2/3
MLPTLGPLQMVEQFVVLSASWFRAGLLPRDGAAPLTASSLCLPAPSKAVAVDADNNYVCGVTNSKVSIVSSSSGDVLRTFNVKGVGTNGIAVAANGDVLVVSGQVYAYGSQGCELRAFGKERLGAAWGIAVGPNGTVFVSCNSGERIVVFDADGTFVRNISQSGRTPGSLYAARGVCVDLDENVLCTSNQMVQMFRPDGTFVRHFESDFQFPHGIAVDAGGRVVVCDSNRDRVQVLRGDGTRLQAFDFKGAGFHRPRATAVDACGRIVVADETANLRVLS